MVRIPLSAAMAVVTIGALGATGASLSGCVIAAGGSAITGYAVLAEDLSPEQQLRDYAIATQVSQAWGEFNQEMAHRLGVTVFDGEVLVTGHVPDRRWRDEAVRRAWRVGGVRRVYDEIGVGPDTRFMDAARDAWITTQLRGELIADINIKSINYTMKTDDGVVYIMGVTRTPLELTLVTGHARTVAGVRRVISFVHPLGARPAMPPPPPGERMAPPPDERIGPPEGLNGPPDDDGDLAAPPDRAAPREPPPSGGGGTIKVEPLP
jgi:osmotically-inducible protein OsmY